MILIQELSAFNIDFPGVRGKATIAGEHSEHVAEQRRRTVHQIQNESLPTIPKERNLRRECAGYQQHEAAWLRRASLS